MKRDFWEKSTRATRWLQTISFLSPIVALILTGGITIENPELGSAEMFLRTTLGIYRPLTITIAIIGVALYLLGSRLAPIPWPPKLSVEEESYIQLYPALKNIDFYLTEGVEVARSQAAKRIAKLASYLDSEDWGTGKLVVTYREIGASLEEFKNSFKDRLIPSVTAYDRESVTRAFGLLKHVAQYMLGPALTELKKINEELAKLPIIIKLKPLTASHIRTHVLVIGSSLVLGAATYLVGPALGASPDTSFFAGVTLLAAIIGGYIAANLRAPR